MIHDRLSPQCSLNWYQVALCKEFASKADHPSAKNQAIPSKAYTMPDQQQRLLCAKLILEEALETINALGCYVTTDATGGKLEVGLDPDEPTLVLDDIIDGCCDTMVVTLGTLVACGVPDSPHMQEVLECNLAKFPGGIATVDKKTGKYLKPEGWKGPDHERVQRSVRRNIPASAPASEQ